MQVAEEEKEILAGVKRVIPIYSLIPNKSINISGKKVYINIKSLKEGHPDISVGSYVYDSYNHYDSENTYNNMFFNNNMESTDEGFHLSRFLFPYNVCVGLFYNNDKESSINWKTTKREQFDNIIKDDNYILGEDFYCFEFVLIAGSPTSNRFSKVGLYNQDKDWITVNESYNYNINVVREWVGDHWLITSQHIFTHYLKLEYNDDDEYYIKLFAEELLQGYDIEKAVIGYYTKYDDISYLTDVKDELFGKGYKAKINKNGICFTVKFSKNGNVYYRRYIIKVISSNMPEFSRLPIVGKSDPYFRFTGLKGKNGYVVENGGVYNLDTYYGYGYHTVLINDDNADLSELKPEFWFGADDYFNLYLNFPILNLTTNPV